MLAAFGVIGLLSAIVPAWKERIGFWTLDGDALRWVGVAIFALGCTLRLWPVFVLGDRFSGLVAIQTGHTLVTTGIYAVIRHPSYLGAIILMAVWSMTFSSSVGLILTTLIVPPLLTHIRAEERLLHK